MLDPHLMKTSFSGKHEYTNTLKNDEMRDEQEEKANR